VVVPDREFLEWVSEPPRRIRRGKWTEILAALRARPGQWARVATTSNTGMATLLRQGKLGDAQPGEFEAVARRDDLGSYDIYARYIPTGFVGPLRGDDD
jgi:16S rRNA C967 or C1407 C5-methylase (RsmB/RsmF family)